MSPKPLRGPPAGVPAFLAGGGEAGALVRSFDWARTPVGPVETWPASLKTTVGTILHSRHPMFLWWGPDLIQFYNDAYSPSFGKGRHPAAMGQRGADCWQDIWPIIWPQIDDVMSRGRPSWNEDHLVPIFRNDRLEEVYWTYGYSPVFDDHGGIGGTLVVCTETTSRVLTDRRLQSMRAFAEATSLATDSAAVIDRTVDILSMAAGDIMFALLYQVRAQSTTPELVRTVGIADDASAAVDGHFRSKLAALAAGSAAQPLPGDVTVTGTLWPEPVSDAVVVPIGSARRVTGYLLCGLSPRLPFDDAYREYLRQLGEHVAHSLERIEAFHLRAVVETERNSLLEQAPVATALMTGPDHVFQLANPRYLHIMGRASLVGQAYRDAFPELTDASVPGVLDHVYRTGEPFVTNEMLVPLDRTGTGTLEDCYFKFNLEPMRNASGEVYGMMAVAVDITPQVVAIKHLEKAQAEREVLLSKLEAASRAKDEFLAMLGHEMRNPLAPILTAVQLMRMRDVRGADMEREIIERQVKHMVGLVDDLLDVSRITRGMIELRCARVQLAEIVAKAIEQASPLIEQRRHRLHVDVPAEFYLDADINRLAQVVSNLLTNAAKYTDPGGDITVFAERREEQVVLHVRDTGIGIDPEMLSHVFETFAQARQRSDRSQGGLGLGLTIVKSLVEAHGGTVALHSEGNGRGTECIVRLPVVTSERALVRTPVTVERRQDTSNGCRVLLVDDNADAAELLAASLRALGHDVEVVFDASAALDLATRFVPDVALLDLGLPAIDGYELASRLRLQEGWAGVRFAALTGYGQQRDRRRTEAAGFDAHLTKPAQVQDVDSTLRRLSASQRKE
jgi:signal transduction histidine kinase/ActR/RegA family two-component response regulator